jgi:hypothetical protein
MRSHFKKSSKSNSVAVPTEITALCKRAPLLVTESREEYEGLFCSVAQTVAPTNYVEWIGTANYVAMVWDIWRLRRAKAGIINATRHEALRTIFESVLPDGEHSFEIAAQLADDWYEKPDQRPAIIERLGKYDLDDEAISAQALALRSAEIEKIDRSIQQLEINCMAQLREIEFHRRALSWRSPKTLTDIAEGTLEPNHLPAPSEETSVGVKADRHHRGYRRTNSATR